MGLDNYFGRLLTGGDLSAPPVVWPEVNLTGGLFSGGNGSFRGKVYAGLVEQITGESLYQGIIFSSEIDKMTKALEGFLEENLDSEFTDKDRGIITREELQDLAKLFRFAVDNSLVLCGWW